MLVVFWLTDSLPSRPALDYRGMLLSLLVAAMGGAIAGALQGGALLWLLPQRQQ
ncbi:hypothetical protein [Vacuolonema iberomarrocanum]|uniref:hypothetical protein n=1 Tax=Vacuolonema iberomarrocanum TaxID=3454632 RepID=UPI0019DF020E|nr:hypothetical protein [filamentous cyanobacterium LEGE 07170]